MPQSHTVDRASTLLAYLREAWPETKRTQILRWLKHKAVTVNGQAVSQFDHPLRRGDVVAVHARGHAAPGTRVGSHMRIRHEDDDLIVIEKPSGLLSIASEGERERSAYFQLTAHVRGDNPHSRARIWVVHRLDRHTSGLTSRSSRAARPRRRERSRRTSTSAIRCGCAVRRRGRRPGVR